VYGYEKIYCRLYTWYRKIIKIEIVPDEEVDTLMNATSKYQTKHKDGKDISL